MNYKELYKAAKKEGRTKDLTPTFIKFEKPGDTIIGKYKGASPVRSALSEGEYNQYIFETDEGLVKFHVGSATDKEIAAQLNAGNVYCVTFEESIKISGGRTVNKFKVEYIDLPFLDADPPLPDEPPLTKKEQKDADSNKA